MDAVRYAMAGLAAMLIVGQDDLKKVAGEVTDLKKEVASLSGKVDAMTAAVAEIKTSLGARTDRETRTECAENLGALIAAMHQASAKGGFPEGSSGRAWVLSLREAKLADRFACPMAEPPGEGKTSYRGYNQKLGGVNAAPGETVVMCDDPANHPDGMNVAFKDGSVRWAAKGSALYKRALDQTTD